ncbi:putative Sulfotransferase domain, P-loop containing nucleoside triphosphate hydrolase [Helianthus annuus]|nr:putative Sulfotransferase domain, P-loop containing nucleoside triphosphate hydrolase [Helianthus annuus]
MALSSSSKMTTPTTTNTITKDEEKERKAKMSSLIERYKDKVSSLPMNVDHDLCKYMGFWHFHGFWYHSKADFSVEAIMALQDHFEAQPTDIFLASHPKSGTTWLKALAFAIMNRNKFKTRSGSCPTHPLLTISPHDCVPFMESENPKDVLTSYWHFLNKLKDDGSTPTKLDDAFELFSRGMSPYGSFWDHVIGYYKASLEQPLKVLFLKYEDLKKNPENEVTKLAKFIGNPFTEEEEFDGSVKKIIELCGFENLSKVNKDGKQTSKVLSDDIYFRKGIVGDSVNYLTNEMIQTLDKITKEKFDGLSISFEA